MLPRLVLSDSDNDYANFMTKSNSGTVHMNKAVTLFNLESDIAPITLKNVIRFT